MNVLMDEMMSIVQELWHGNIVANYSNTRGTACTEGKRVPRVCFIWEKLFYCAVMEENPLYFCGGMWYSNKRTAAKCGVADLRQS